jgi:hypothetical protein
MYFGGDLNIQLKTVIKPRVQTDPSDDFSSIWLKALDEIGLVSISTELIWHRYRKLLVPSRGIAIGDPV